MKKILLSLVIFTFQASVWAQDSTQTQILASDPTQVYTHIDFNGGISFESYPNHFGPESWDFNLTGNIAIKDFLVGARIPFTNDGSTYSLLGDLEVFAGYQLFNRKGIFKSSSVKAGILFPTSYDGDRIIIGRQNRGFFNYYFNYTAAFQITPKLSAYPLIGVRQYQSVEQGSSFFPTRDSIYTPPDFIQTAFNAAVTISYDFNTRSFVQFNMFYERGIWRLSDGSDLLVAGNSEIVRSTLFYSLKYQYRITGNSHLYLQAAYHPQEKWHEPFDQKIGFNQPKIVVGYQYYLK